MSRASRRYRTKLEVLRDVLWAAKRTPRQTRIIGMANLNLESFSRYARFTVAEGLRRRENGGYEPRRSVTVEFSELSEANDGVTLTGSNLVPGQTVFGYLTIKNTGTVHADVSAVLYDYGGLVSVGGLNAYEVRPTAA